jgi:DNA transformation protein
MSISNADIAFVKDLFAGVSTLTARKMLGGLAIYADRGHFCTYHPHGRFNAQGKGRACTRARRTETPAFIQDGKDNRAVAMPYWTLPAAAMDEPELACDWARRSLMQTS